MMLLREYYRDNELRIRCPLNSAVDNELQRQTAYAMTLQAYAKRITVCVVEGERKDCFPPSVRRPPSIHNILPPYTKEELLQK